MWEVFKFLLLCLISIIIGLTASFIYVCALLIVLVLVFYDFDFAVGLEHHAINKFNNLYLKVRNYYLKSKTTLHIEQPNTITDSFLYTPIMNSINKQTSSFELSRFNKSGNALSPITNSASSTTLSSRRLVQARQTSTPLTKTPPWQQSATNSIRSPHINSSLMNRSPRYSLSSVNASPKADGSPKPTIQTVTGPLLASTRFNVNLGTYMDTKSPGLASRVVQYNNELSGEQSSTHQAKYGSPGQFPIVQLYKKELPILTRTPRRCTVRIAPPDPVSYSSDHASTILRDSFMQKNIDNTSKHDQCDTEINTKSVLEALKEISRKRIHTNDDLEDISKRQRKNSIHSPKNPDHLNKDGKRMREDTPPKPKDASNTTPINSAPKRICVVNEIESSLSSSRLMRLQQGQKRKSTVNLSENNKQRKISNGELVSRETQTISNGFKSNTLSTSTSTNTNTSKISTAAQTETEKPEQPINNVQSILESARRKKNSDRRTIDDIDEENSTLQFSEVNKKTTKPFFSEAPLEILKQNKLAVMISALSGQKAELIPLPVMTLSALKKRAEEDKTDGGETREVVSILSPKNKIKHDKHVTFSIPNFDSESNSKSDETTLVAASPAPSTIDTISFNPPISQIVTTNPIQFSTPSTTSSSSNSISVPKSNFNFSSAITATSMPSPSNNISFGPITTTTVSTNIITSSIENKGNISLESQNKPSTAPTFNSSFEPLKTNFGGLVPSPNTEKSESTKSTTGFSVSSTSSVPKLATTSTTSSNMFGIGTSNSLTFPASSVNNVSQPTIVFSSSNPPAFSIPTTSATSAPNTIEAALNEQPSILPTSNTTSASNFFNFGAKTDSKASPAVNTSLGHRSGGFVFDLRTTTVTSTTTTERSKQPPAFNAGSAQNTFTFGATTTASVSLPTTSAITFGTPISSTATTTTSAPIFGATNTNAFGTSTTLANTSGFSTPSSTAKNLFGISTTTKTGVFNTNTTTASSGMFGSTGVFGNANTSTNSTPATSTTTSSNVFGAPTTQKTSGIFGSTVAPSAFGSTKTDNPAPPAFGSFGTANTTQNTSGFRAFNAPTTTQNAPSFTAFGSTATTQANSFGSTPTTTQNTTFGNVPTTTQNNTFGSIATTTQSATFGSAPTSTNKAFTFGASTTPKEFSFGSSTTATTTASNVFGSTTTPTASNLFGGNANSAFRNATTTPSNAFGATTTTTTAPSTFGQSSSGVFGTANNSSFNNNATGSVFGGNNNNNNSSAFGTTAPSVFGATNQPASNFAVPGTSNVFGGGNNNANQTGNTMFGTKTNNTTFGSNTSAFGTSGFNNNNGGNNNTAPAPSFGNFGSPAAQPAAPQSSGVFAFGSSAPPAAVAPTASNAFQFGAATQTPKPGGFNFSGSSAPNINFGSGATPSFSASPAPAFGSPAPSGFNANAPATGMFNIGSGSTAPKQRPMIKARRRN